MAIKTYPLNDIDYQAEDAELFHCTRTSGVYASGHFPVSVTGTDNNITIGKGIGWLKNTEFSGKVFASKEETTLNAGVPDASLPRVDAVVVRFDANQNETYLTIKQGFVGSTPTPPEVERGEYIYELHLYHIRRRPGATAITPGDITDLRMDANYCGLMADSVTQVDMSAINAQVREFISDWESQIANVTNGKLVESTEYPGCFYRLYAGMKEWLNPPMIVGVEYRTTGRMDGKTVYTKLLKARSQADSVELPDAEKVVSLSAVAVSVSTTQNLAFQIPAFELPTDSKRVQKMQVYYDSGRIYLESVVAKGTYDMYITASYTKSGITEYTNVYQDGNEMFVDTSGSVSASGDNVSVQMYADVADAESAYVRNLTINGERYELAVNQTGTGVPGNAHPGVVGQFYMDTDTGDVYKCISANDETGIYAWQALETALSAPVQSDWSQNDPTQPDYVKNRTHQVERGGSLLLANTVDNWKVLSNGILLKENIVVATNPVSDGKTYTVVFDRTSYICTGQVWEPEGTSNWGTHWFLGNIELFGGMPSLDNLGQDMPFLILFRQFRSTGGIYASVYTRGPNRLVTYELYAGDSRFTPLDEQYIPATIARSKDIPQIPTVSISGGIVFNDDPTMCYEIVNKDGIHFYKACELFPDATRLNILRGRFGKFDASGFEPDSGSVYGAAQFGTVIHGGGFVQYGSSVCAVYDVNLSLGDWTYTAPSTGIYLWITAASGGGSGDSYLSSIDYTVDYLSEPFIPGTIARSASSHGLSVADAAGDAPTAAEFNALLAALREAGYLATE